MYLLWKRGFASDLRESYKMKDAILVDPSVQLFDLGPIVQYNGVKNDAVRVCEMKNFRH